MWMKVKQCNRISYWRFAKRPWQKMVCFF